MRTSTNWTAKGGMVRIEIHDDVAQVVLDRPDKLNAVNLEMLSGVLSAAKHLRRQRRLRAVILRGEGRAFCAGMDFKAVLSKPSAMLGAYLQLWRPARNKFQRWSLSWRELGVPVIALVQGHCYGAGLQLALGADIRIASPDARLSVMESKWGLVPDMGGAVLLRELLRIDVAKELTMSGRTVDAHEAHKLGLLSYVDAEPMSRAESLIEEFRQRSPDAVAAGKFLMQAAWNSSERHAASLERTWQRRLIGRANQGISVARNSGKAQAAFQARRIG